MRNPLATPLLATLLATLPAAGTLPVAAGDTERMDRVQILLQ